jgi:hypothetical protein
LRKSVRAHPELRAFTTAAGPQAENVAFPIEGHADGRVERSVGHLTIAHLDHDGVHEDGGVDLIERSGGPIGHLVEHPVCNPGDGLLGHARAVDLLEVRGDLPGRQALRVEGEHHLVDALEPALPLLDDDRLEDPRTVARNADLDLAAGVGQHRLRPHAVTGIARPRAGWVVLLVSEVPSQFFLQRRLDDGLGELLEKPARPGQRQPPLTGLPHQLRRNLLLSRLLVLVLLRCHIRQCRGHPRTFPPARRLAYQAGNTARRTVPALLE